MSDDELLKAASQGDRKAFELIVKKYQNELYYTALGILRSGWDALDICQDTFLKAFTSIHTLRDVSKFRSWINIILINKCNDFFRRRQKVEVIGNIELEGFFEEPTADNLDLLEALSFLREETRIVLTLRYFQDLPIKEIAAILSCPEGTVKSRINHGLKELRLLIEPAAEKEGVK